jgi:hypothetical protein
VVVAEGTEVVCGTVVGIELVVASVSGRVSEVESPAPQEATTRQTTSHRRTGRLLIRNLLQGSRKKSAYPFNVSPRLAPNKRRESQNALACSRPKRIQQEALAAAQNGARASPADTLKAVREPAFGAANAVS